jgi:hypothetical protein
MADFVLPSGRVVQTQEPLWGAYLHAITAGLDKPEEYAYLKAAAVVPGLSRDEVAALSREDGIALNVEVTRVFNGRPEEKEIPFGNNSSSASPEETLPKESPSIG